MTTLVVSRGLHIGPSETPRHTLGWDVLGWTAEYLLQPDGPNAGEPWEFTNEQALFVLNWYAVDETGRFVYRSGMLRRMKGWGKDPLGAALCCVEMVGPCRFAGWENGNPVAEPHYAAWVQTAAVSREQTRNTMTLFPGMLSPRAIEEYSIDIGKEIIYAEKGRKRIEAITSSPRAIEGGRPTLVLKNETHHWIQSNEGHAMAAVIARNAAKSRDGATRVLGISNAHAPGEQSDAEHDYEAWRKVEDGTSDIKDFLYDSLEVEGEVDLLDDDALRDGLMATRGDSNWVDVDRLIAEIRDPRTSAATARRFYLNQIVAEEDKPFNKARFLELVQKDYVVPARAYITLGFDGSVNRDHTALIGTEIKTGYQWVVGYWEPEIAQDGEVKISYEAVDSTVDYAFSQWRVWRMEADPSWWKDSLSHWAGKYGADKIVEVPANQFRRMAVIYANYRDALRAGNLTNDGNKHFVASIGNCYKHLQHFRDDKGEQMWLVQKERPDSPLKIDAVPAAALSWDARTLAIAAGISGDEPPTLAIGNAVGEDDRKPEFSGIRGADF